MPASIKAWAFKESKNVIVSANDNVKDRVSVMTSITSYNEKLPLLFILKADNKEDTNLQLGDLIENNKYTYSTSYVNFDCMIQHLHF